MNMIQDIDEESDIKKIKIAKKKAIGKAKRFFNEQKEKYYKPLESSTAKLSERDSKSTWRSISNICSKRQAWKKNKSGNVIGSWKRPG